MSRALFRKALITDTLQTGEFNAAKSSEKDGSFVISCDESPITSARCRDVYLISYLLCSGSLGSFPCLPQIYRYSAWLISSFSYSSKDREPRHN